VSRFRTSATACRRSVKQLCHDMTTFLTWGSVDRQVSLYWACRFAGWCGIDSFAIYDRRTLPELNVCPRAHQARSLIDQRH